ncbi:MAG: hypothetical protein Q8Q04_03205, partial [archaeon]|nr:hypothetical protein [archaeon]
TERECREFNMQFLWFKNSNMVRVIAAGNCNCKNDINDFYIQFDVHLRENENAAPDARNRYQIVGFEDVFPYEYLTDPEEESNAIIKVNCCKKCSNQINWEEDESSEEESSDESKKTSLLPRKQIFTDPDEFLAALESGAFTPTAHEREDFLKGTLCSKILDKNPTPEISTEPKPEIIPRPEKDETTRITPDANPTPQTIPPSLPPTSTVPVDCHKVCTSKGWTTQKQDKEKYKDYIFSEAKKYECVSGIEVKYPGSYKMGPCTCYDHEMKPEIIINKKIPVCKDTFCGDVLCGESKNCELPGAIAQATCQWMGWKEGSSGLPSPVIEVT